MAAKLFMAVAVIAAIALALGFVLTVFFEYRIFGN